MIHRHDPCLVRRSWRSTNYACIDILAMNCAWRGETARWRAAMRDGELDTTMKQHKTLRSATDLIAAGLGARGANAARLTRWRRAMRSPSRRRSPTLIDPADPHDPIARQFVPDAAELSIQPEERADPIGDDAHSPVEGIVHRYPDRVLLKLVHVCPVYCRYCFRREMVGPRGRGTLSAAGDRGGARLYPRDTRNLGSHSDRRRAAAAVATPVARVMRRTCRDRSRQDRARAYAHAGRGAGAHFTASSFAR